MVAFIGMHSLCNIITRMLLCRKTEIPSLKSLERETKKDRRLEKVIAKGAGEEEAKRRPNKKVKMRIWGLGDVSGPFVR